MINSMIDKVGMKAALAVTLTLSACAPTLPPVTINEPQWTQRSELVCVLNRFLIVGQPAERAGFEVQDATANLLSNLQRVGLKTYVPTDMVDRYQGKWINVPSPDLTARSEEGTVAQLDSSVLRSFRESLLEDLSAIDARMTERPPCDWFLLSQVNVEAPFADRSSAQRLAQTTTRISMIQSHDETDVASADKSGLARGLNDRAAILNAMSYSFEAVSDHIAHQLVGRVPSYMIDVQGLRDHRLAVYEALADQGFEPGQSSPTSTGFRLSAANDASPLDIERGLKAIEDRLRLLDPSVQITPSGTSIEIVGGPR